LRYLVSAFKVPPFETWEAAFAPGFNPDPRDDGWWLDDVRISESLASPAVLIVDDNDLAHCLGDPDVGCLTVEDCIVAGTAGPCLGAAPQCGPTCTVLTVAVTTDPDETGGALDEVLTAPGQVITLNVSSSSQCLDGALLYRFARADGTVLREFSENPVLVAAPQVDTDYLVEIRCSANAPGFECDAAVVVDVDVGCPTSGSLAGVFPQILATSKTDWEWMPAREYLLYSNPIGIWYGSAIPTTGSGSSFSDSSLPDSGKGTYYVLREQGEFCNERGPWTACNPTDQACVNAEDPSRETSLP